ncbi:hypothetical protein BO71DRAFT_392753 [Aspergillus ellipticus CBS 707.79]|uniref:Rhodopsin domain-containing protein n=1 Tax=Aspergillus ellipticus CBS 707.79 TaxID=1448320 RepID=A0A319CTI1_9EURO|nr:hypothetical protein BO71DRAFT_392753 [Aspergillus ellipticus CBS 707.79]
MVDSEAPFEVLSSTDRGGLITLVSAAFLITAIIFAAAKLGSLIYFKHRRTSVSTPIWVALVVVIQKAVDHGLGQHIDTLTDTAIQTLSKYTYAAQLMQIIITSLSEASTTLLVWKLTPHHGIRRACMITLGVVVAWTFFAIFGIAFQCKLPSPWLYSPSRCAGEGAILYPIIIIHILTEIVVIIIPFFMMHNVQIKWATRFQILCSFSARILVVAMAISQLALLPSLLGSADPSWDIVNFIICGQTMVCTSVTIACLPTLYHIFAGLHSGLLTTQLPDETELKHPNGSSSLSQYAVSRRKSGLRYSNNTASASKGKKHETMRRSSISESTESTWRLTQEVNPDGGVEDGRYYD